MSDAARGAYDNDMRELLGYECHYSNMFGCFDVQISGGVQTRLSDVDPVAFIGGGGDRWASLNIYSVNQEFKLLNPSIPTRYFTQNRRDAILRYLRSVGSSPITLIGHSWGADTAAKIAANAMQTLHRTINLLITVDPVGLGITQTLFAHIRADTDRWINITVNPTNPDVSDFIANMGQKWPSSAGAYADENYTFDTNQGDLYGMLNGARRKIMSGGGC